MDEVNYDHARHASAWIASLKGKWTISILLAMRDHPVRLADLRRLIPEATKKMLIDSLKRLEGEGLVQRKDLSKLMKHVEYEIVDDLKSLVLQAVDNLATVPHPQKDAGEI